MKTERLMSAVHEITKMLASTLDPAEGLRRTLPIAAEAVSATGGAIWQHDPLRRALVCRHVVGEKADALREFVIRDDEGIAGHVFHTAKVEVENHVYGNPHHLHRVDEILSHQTRNMVSVPICYPGGVTVGVIQLINKAEGGFLPDDLVLLDSISDIAAMSLHVADLSQKAARTEALDYVGHFAHDIYNRLQTSYGGLPILRSELEELIQRVEKEHPDVHVGAVFESLLSQSLDPVIDDAHLIYRYMRLIAGLVKGTARLDIVKENRDLRDTIEAQFRQLRRFAEKRGVTLTCDLPAQPFLCPHDTILMGSAVYNLINNAVPEAPHGKVMLRLTAQGNHAVISVQDTGRGMPAAIMESILSGSPYSTKPGGTGLGTLIVKRVAELHGGTLEGESEPGVGTTFRICLPID